MKQKTLIIGVVVAVVLGVTLYFSASMQTSGKLTMVGDTNVACLPNGHQQLALHIHPKLSITVDGVPETIPANIGITGTCMAELHTHDATGVIHLETATADRFEKLVFADFFEVWGVPLEREGYTYALLVDGTPVASVNDVPLADGVNIALTYTKVE